MEKVKVTIFADHMMVLGHRVEIIEDPDDANYCNAACEADGSKLTFGRGYMNMMSEDGILATCAHEIGHMLCIKEGERFHMRRQRYDGVLFLIGLALGDQKVLDIERGGEVAAELRAADLVGTELMLSISLASGHAWHPTVGLEGEELYDSYCTVHAAKGCALIDRYLSEQGLDDFHL